MKINPCKSCKVIPSIKNYIYRMDDLDVTLSGIHCCNPRCAKHSRTKLYRNGDDAIHEWNTKNPVRSNLFGGVDDTNSDIGTDV